MRKRDTIKIVSFNIRCPWNNADGINCFLGRAGLIWEKITTEKPDIVAFQEVTPRILSFLNASLSADYDIYGQFRTADYDGEGVFTAVRRDTYEMIGQENFWLSPTPYVPGSRFEDQSIFPRICVVLTLRHRRSGEILQVYNLHLDHKGDAARKKGMECIREVLSDNRAKRPLASVVLGDFNAWPFDPVMEYCRCGMEPELVDLTRDIPVTCHGFGTKTMKIDYIFTTEDLAGRCVSSGIWDDCLNGIYLSDHYPVWAEFE